MSPEQQRDTTSSQSQILTLSQKAWIEAFAVESPWFLRDFVRDAINTFGVKNENYSLFIDSLRGKSADVDSILFTRPTSALHSVIEHFNARRKKLRKLVERRPLLSQEYCRLTKLYYLGVGLQHAAIVADGGLNGDTVNSVEKMLIGFSVFLDNDLTFTNGIVEVKPINVDKLMATLID